MDGYASFELDLPEHLSACEMQPQTADCICLELIANAIDGEANNGEDEFSEDNN